MRLVGAIMLGLLVAAPLAACDDKGDKAAGEEKTSSSESPSASGGEDGESSDSSEKPGDDSSEVMTLKGTIVDGVEPNCVMFEAEGDKYQLIGGKTKDLKQGDKVTVTGKISEKTMSSCMAGKVFEVETVKSG
ncbi:MAG: hypothetical protein ACRD0P_35495 [Stackebrandtia sp.]